jgi:hypothetical protein
MWHCCIFLNRPLGRMFTWVQAQQYLWTVGRTPLLVPNWFSQLYWRPEMRKTSQKGTLVACSKGVFISQVLL